jgi:hypothetical protein
VLPLILSLIGILLLVANIPSSIAWRCGSGLALILMFAMGMWYSRSFRTVPRGQIHDAAGTRVIFYIGGSIGGIIIVLQLYNLIWPGVFWPFFSAIVVWIVAAIVQFIRMVVVHEN